MFHSMYVTLSFLLVTFPFLFTLHSSLYPLSNNKTLQPPVKIPIVDGEYLCAVLFPGMVSRLMLAEMVFRDLGLERGAS
jgi:hypothetical protein